LIQQEGLINSEPGILKRLTKSFNIIKKERVAILATLSFLSSSAYYSTISFW